VHDDGFYFKPFVSWSEITSGNLGFRYFGNGFTSNVKGMSAFPLNGATHYQLLSLLNSKLVKTITKAINPTLTFGINNLYSIPAAFIPSKFVSSVTEQAVQNAQLDWDSYETSWSFTTLPLLSTMNSKCSIEKAYLSLRSNWRTQVSEMKYIEEENNRVLLEAYSLEDELTTEVPIEEISLTCNPAYRYGTKISEEEREVRLKADTMREFLSYAVGCMFGRYSLDEPGLILANQGETLEDYLKRVPEPSFMPDDDNVIPLIDFDGDWFEDDITERFKQFLKVTFGEEHYQENIAFIEDALGKSIKKFFVKDFYTDHVKRYKKRPIYWLFSSPKGTFNALIYMHRYTPSTVSVVLNEYLREFRTKLEARRDNCEQITISASASQKEKTQALKLKDKLTKAIEEVNDYERETLYPLAGQNISIDLDDGVKHNYPLFGKALKKVTGLS
jgi:type II restriction/modification system DNA methylase subunit YeeA